jgi:hypothetical protein
VLCCAVLCCAVCVCVCAVLCCAVLCCAMLCCVCARAGVRVCARVRARVCSCVCSCVCVVQQSFVPCKLQERQLQVAMNYPTLTLLACCWCLGCWFGWPCCEWKWADGWDGYAGLVAEAGHSRDAQLPWCGRPLGSSTSELCLPLVQCSTTD